jgi:signal transduction histidine kinase
MPTRSVQPPDVRERIGGRWAVSWQLGAAACGVILLTWALTALGAQLPLFHPGAPGAVSVALQCAAVVGVLIVADVTVLRNRRERPVPIWVVATVGGVAGVARLAVEAATAASTRPLGQTAIITIAVIGFTATIPPVVAYLLATREWYVQTRDRLIRLELDEEARRLRADGAIDALERVVVEGAQTRLEDASADARRALDDAAREPIVAADALLRAAREEVRPTGRSLAEAIGPEAPAGISPLRAIATELHRHPLPILLPAIYAALVSMPRAVAISGVVNALVMPAVIAASIAAVFLMSRPVVRRLPRLAIPITFAAAVLAVIPPVIIQGLVFEQTAAPQTFAFLALVIFVTTFVVSAVQTLEDSSTEVLEALRRPLKQTEFQRIATERALAQLQREIGLQLHSGVQPQLVAASYAIQDAVARGDAAALEAAIADARLALDRRLEPTGPRAHADIITTVSAQWHGILAITWDPSELPAEAQSAAVTDVVRECLSNAVVHGLAERATVAVTTSPDAVVVRIADDGQGPRGGAAGFGSAVLNEATGGDWSIAPGPTGGAVVTARLPLPAAG